MQNNNKRSNVFVEINGEIKTLAEWSEISGLNYLTIWLRYAKGKRGQELIDPTKPHLKTKVPTEPYKAKHRD